MTHVALAVAVRGGKVLVARRRGGDHLGGAWEFPGGKVRPGERAADAARRELREETGLVGGHLRSLMSIRHRYPDRDLRLRVFVITGTRGEARPLASEAVEWRHPRELDAAAMPPANAPILARLRRGASPRAVRSDDGR